jgi:gliding motility-associated-like protein
LFLGRILYFCLPYQNTQVMRKIILLSFICFVILSVFAIKPTIIGNHKKYDKITGKDTVTVIIFDSITNSTKIQYEGSDVKFYKFGDVIPSGSYSTFLFPPVNATGYIVEVDGKNDTIFVIDYKQYKPIFNSIAFDPVDSFQCANLKLKLSNNIPTLRYQTADRTYHTLPREFTISYKTLKWDANKWVDDSIKTLPTILSSEISVKAPLCNTDFTLSGDQYAKDLGISQKFKSALLYTAVAVEGHPSVIETNRTERNEADRPSITTPTPFSKESSTPITGSAPLDLQFLSNANEPSTRYYFWEILKNGKHLVAPRVDKDQRYSFTEAGVYTVKIKSSNDYCSSSDTIIITVLESAIQVPNVFTPNGDGINDEFRVAYKSIVRFHCWVYNRWGRKVFEWTDPQKGWDGTIGTSKAEPGPYFYVIEAYGSDVDAKGTPKKYLLKGDINLLRGKE